MQSFRPVIRPVTRLADCSLWPHMSKPRLHKPRVDRSAHSPGLIQPRTPVRVESAQLHARLGSLLEGCHHKKKRTNRSLTLLTRGCRTVRELCRQGLPYIDLPIGTAESRQIPHDSRQDLNTKTQDVLDTDWRCFRRSYLGNVESRSR